MILTQRIFLLVIFINLIIGISLQIYTDPTAFSNTQAERDVDALEEFEGIYTDDDNLNVYQESSNDFIPSALNLGRSGLLIIKIVFKSLNPFAITPSMVDTEVEKLVVVILSYFRYIMAVLVTVEVFYFVRGKFS